MTTQIVEVPTKQTVLIETPSTVTVTERNTEVTVDGEGVVVVTSAVQQALEIERVTTVVAEVPKVTVVTAGVQGPQGPQGDTGPTGATGATGATGPQGDPQDAAGVRALGFFDTTNDGTGSGLDADLLDGQEASAFAAASHTHVVAEITDIGTWTGSTAITTLGTITTGTWQGTAVADGYIASAATWNAKIGPTTGSANEVLTDDGVGGLTSNSNLKFDGITLSAPAAGSQLAVGTTTPATNYGVDFRDSVFIQSAISTGQAILSLNNTTTVNNIKALICSVNANTSLSAQFQNNGTGAAEFLMRAQGTGDAYMRFDVNLITTAWVAGVDNSYNDMFVIQPRSVPNANHSTFGFGIDTNSNCYIGSSTLVGGTNGKVLVLGDNAGHPTPGTNTAAFYATDVSGTVTPHCVDEAGNIWVFAKQAAITQTYATASATHAALTSATLTDSTGGTADTTVAAVSGSGDDATINNNFADLIAQVNALRADLENAKQVINTLVDYGQTIGAWG